MNLLAIETSTDACSVALARGERTASRHEILPRQHTRLLVPMIDELLDAAGLAAADLDGIVLGAGPGSFIGVRIAASVAQGLAFAAGASLLPVSSLAAIAAEVFAAGSVSRVLVAQDARMNEVYLAGYEADESLLPVPLLPVRLAAAGAVEDLPPGCAAAGAGWQRYPSLFDENRGRLTHSADVRYPHAEALLRIARARWRHDTAIAPERLELDYVRDRVARVAPPPDPVGGRDHS